MCGVGDCVASRTFSHHDDVLKCLRNAGAQLPVDANARFNERTRLELSARGLQRANGGKKANGYDLGDGSPRQREDQVQTGRWKSGPVPLRPNEDEWRN